MAVRERARRGGDAVTASHSPEFSGLRHLAYHYEEHEAIRALTRLDFFKFTFVRNPFERLASVYLNKHVDGGPPYSRQFWNRVSEGWWMDVDVSFKKGTHPDGRACQNAGSSEGTGLRAFVGIVVTVPFVYLDA